MVHAMASRWVPPCLVSIINSQRRLNSPAIQSVIKKFLKLNILYTMVFLKF